MSGVRWKWRQCENEEFCVVILNVKFLDIQVLWLLGYANLELTSFAHLHLAPIPPFPLAITTLFSMSMSNACMIFS